MFMLWLWGEIDALKWFQKGIFEIKIISIPYALMMKTVDYVYNLTAWGDGEQREHF